MNKNEAKKDIFCVEKVEELNDLLKKHNEEAFLVLFKDGKYYLAIIEEIEK